MFGGEGQATVPRLNISILYSQWRNSSLIINYEYKTLDAYDTRKIYNE